MPVALQCGSVDVHSAADQSIRFERVSAVLAFLALERAGSYFDTAGLPADADSPDVTHIYKIQSMHGIVLHCTCCNGFKLLPYPKACPQNRHDSVSDPVFVPCTGVLIRPVKPISNFNFPRHYRYPVGDKPRDRAEYF